jgi:high affinity Mn2+ porin
VIEAEKIFTINKSNAISVRVAGFYNRAHAGNYDLSVKNALANFSTPDIESTRIYSRSKAGFYINTEYNFTNGGVFLVGSWNDGKNETWAFTEIDHSVSAGLSLNGPRWNRNKDVFGIAIVFNGLSKQHSNYLKQGGYGFMMGDGTLNYGLESIIETYYSFQLPFKFVKAFVSPNYQFVVNPAYNKDRGPVHVVALRLHIAI